MTLFIFIIFIFVTLFAALRYGRVSLTLGVVGLTFFILAGCGLLNYFILSKLQSPFQSSLTTSQTWQNNNCIISLGSGTVKVPHEDLVLPSFFSYSRMTRTFELYTSCKKNPHQCYIIISGGDPLKTGKSEANVIGDELIKMGVNPNDIVIESKSANTFRNAQYTKAILNTLHCDKSYLVTSGFHMSRALLYFKYFDLDPTPIIADYIAPTISLIPSGYHFAITDLVIHEYLGMLRYYFYNLMGWNPSNN